MAEGPIRVRLNDGPIELDCDIEVEEGWISIRMGCGGAAVVCVISPRDAGRLGDALSTIAARARHRGTGG